MFCKEHNFFGGHGIVGGQIPLGAGLAFADKYQETGAVTFTYMGDGAIRQGSFHETMNLAMLWNLPVVFVIENNGYAMGTSVERTANHTDLYKLGLGYEMPCSAVDGMDPVEVYNAMHEAATRARKGNGPTLLEVRTYRYKGHSMSDAQHYRTKDEVAEFQKRDPIGIVQKMLQDKKYASDDDFKAIEKRVKELVSECVKFADDSDFPTADNLYKHVYIQNDYPFIKTN